MITFQDCIAFTEFDEETLHLLVARHRLPDIIAEHHHARFDRASQGWPDPVAQRAAAPRATSKRSAVRRRPGA